MTRKAHQLKNFARIGTLSDRSGGTMEGRTVARGTAGLMVALDNALKALTLGDAGDIDVVADLEGGNVEGLAELETTGIRDANLAPVKVVSVEEVVK